ERKRASEKDSSEACATLFVRAVCFNPLLYYKLLRQTGRTLPTGSGAWPLIGHVCVVTGASRGIGKGVALQLSEAGATVYITGRNRETLEQAAAEVQSRGSKCVPVVCDSTREEDVAALFERVRKEQAGRLDVLVNSAFSATSLWDQVNNAGLRGNYFCTVHAARLMVPAGRGLIVIISSPGGLRYMFDVPYGVGKAACDRMAADCGVELRPFGVACVSLWPGLVRTELVVQQAEDVKKLFKDLPERLANMAESPEKRVLLLPSPKVKLGGGNPFICLFFSLQKIPEFCSFQSQILAELVLMKEKPIETAHIKPYRILKSANISKCN
uniref:Dehydrogenase/reductase 1 n=1 Tax=Pseudonaja textilis TaxID=8673 RepID=A0A670Y6I9_PSETE